MRYWILVALYLALILYFAYQTPQTTISKWPLLQKEPYETLVTHCQDTKDCPRHYICMNNTCVPKLLRGEECYPETGEWTLVSHRNKNFAACICKYPDVVTQKHFGGNCDVDLSCGPQGYMNMQTMRCICAEGFVPIGRTCRKMTVLDRMKYESCDANEMHVSQIKSEGFHSSYIRQHRDKKCFKRPCTFDAMTGKPLKKARYEKDVGCVCDPSLGQFGVRLDGMEKYILDKGYNACVSIFKHPLEEPIPVEIYAYFYLADHPPIVFIHYTDVQNVIAPLDEFVKDGTLQISQEYPFDFMQAFFRSRQPFLAKLIAHTEYHLLFNSISREHVTTVENQMEWCQFMSRHLKPSDSIFTMKNKLIFGFPACYIGKEDKDAPEMYRGRYVSNPLHMTLPDDPYDHRSNGLLLSFKNGEWTLESAPSYKFDVYSQITDTVPHIKDEIVDHLVQNPKVVVLAKSILGDMIQNKNDEYHANIATQLKEPFFLNKDETGS